MKYWAIIDYNKPNIHECDIVNIMPTKAKAFTIMVFIAAKYGKGKVSDYVLRQICFDFIPRVYII